MSWKLIDTGKESALRIMQRDAELLNELHQENSSILHLYDWQGDAATYGHFIDPSEFLDMEGVRKRGLELARRPTGGGIIFHNCDFAFSVLVPASFHGYSERPLENYAFINKRIIWVIQKWLGSGGELLAEEPQALDTHCKSFCMSKPTKYDIMIDGRKVGGAAQRKTRYGFLHQGSIFLGLLPDGYLKDILLSRTLVQEGMRLHSFPLLGESWTERDLTQARLELKELIKRAFSKEELG